MSEAELKKCASECSRCHEVCIETMNHCLKSGGKHVEQKHFTLMIDCAQICATNSDFLLRQSSLHAETCRACAEVCDACADDCEKLGDEHMKRCATTCRSCAESCRAMSMAAV